MDISNIFNKKKVVIGLDIGQFAIKAVVLDADKKSGNIKIQNIGYYELLSDPSKQEEDRMGLVMEGIKNVIQQLHIKSNYVSVATPGQSLSVKDFKIPAVTPDKLNNMVMLEVTQQIPFPIEEVELDYTTIPLSDTELLVLAAAVKKDIVAQLNALLAGAGLEPHIIDARPFAVFNSLIFNKFIAEDKVTSIIDIGASSTDITVMRGSHLMLSRTASIGGNNYTKIIQQFTKKNFSDAEQYKYKNISIAPLISMTGIPNKSEINGALKILTERLVGEIRRSFDYFKGLPNGADIDRIVVTGGTSKLKGLVSYISNSTNIETIMADPLCSLSVSDEIEQRIGFNVNQFTCAIGLGIRNLTSTALSFDLTPKEIRQRKLKENKKRYLTIAGVLFGLSIGLWMYSLYQEKMSYINTKSQIDAEISRLQSVVPEIEKMKTEKKRLNKRVEAIKTVIEKKKFWLDVLRELNNIIPNNAWISGINFSDEGDISFSGTTYKLQDVSTFMGKITDSQFFKDVELSNTTTSEGDENTPPTTSFNLSFKMAIDTPVIVAKAIPDEEIIEEDNTENDNTNNQDNDISNDKDFE